MLLGEEGAAGGTVRYVDSSLERLQVKLSGLPPQRYLLTCNGVPVPLQPTGRVGEFVAGVRYRAWQPANCLQPTIAVHAPLVFDLLDTWMRTLAGRLPVSRRASGGRNYDSLPVNANEAESRRMARFSASATRLGSPPYPSVVINDEFPDDPGSAAFPHKDDEPYPTVTPDNAVSEHASRAASPLTTKPGNHRGICSVC